MMFNTYQNLILIFAVLLSSYVGVAALQKEHDDHRQSIASHDKAVHLMDDWMRDPFIELAPDGYYYLSCTRQNSSFPNELPAMEFWRSPDLVDWQPLGIRWQAKDTPWGKALIEAGKKGTRKAMIWAPEIYFLQGRWIVISTSNQRRAYFGKTAGDQLSPPYNEPFGLDFGHHHDPALFVDDDGTTWLVAKCAAITQLNRDLTGFVGDEIKIGPSNRKLGHEGCYIIKIKDTYVLFGTAWSTDTMRHGTYNLYYCTAKHIKGPYGPRRFAGRFLGHGTPFQDKQGRWWCTAFYNANKPALDPLKAKTMDLSDTAYTINKQGLTLVPLNIQYRDGDVYVHPQDEAYRYPGAEEVQKFKP